METMKDRIVAAKMAERLEKVAYEAAVKALASEMVAANEPKVLRRAVREARLIYGKESAVLAACYLHHSAGHYHPSRIPPRHGPSLACARRRGNRPE